MQAIAFPKLNQTAAKFDYFRAVIPPLQLNLYKGIIAIALINSVKLEQRYITRYENAVFNRRYAIFRQNFGQGDR